MNVKATIREFIQSELIPGAQEDELKDDTPLIETAIIDSLGIIRLVSFIEDRFGVEVAPEDQVPDNFQSIEAIAALVRAKSEGLATER